MFGKETARMRNQRKNHLVHIIVKIRQNTQEISGDLKRLAVTQMNYYYYYSLQVFLTFVSRWSFTGV